MSTSNQALLRKADLALSDLTGGGGYLVPEQSNRFFRRMIDTPTLLNEVRVVPMNSPTMEVNKLGLGQRILYPAPQGLISTPELGEVGGRALPRAQRVVPATSKITLSTKEVIAEINIPLEVLEDNIERDALQSTLLDMMAERTALDLEEKIILGDITSADPYLAMQNGIVAGTTSNIVNVGGAPISPDMFKRMLQGLPTKYHRLLPQFRFYTSMQREISLRSAIASRQTGLGDAALTSSAPLNMLGVNVKGAALIPDTMAFLLNPKNIIFGVQRRISIAMENEIRERAVVIVMTLRIDHKYEEEDMVVKATMIGADA